MSVKTIDRQGLFGIVRDCQAIIDAASTVLSGTESAKITKITIDQLTKEIINRHAHTTLRPGTPPRQKIIR